MKRDWDGAFSPTPDIFHERMVRTLGAIEEGNEMKRRYKVSVLLVAALAVLALAGGIALAAANGVFAWAAGLYADKSFEERYSTLNELADTTVQEKSTADGLVNIALEQNYYNGTELYIGYSMKSADELKGFEADFVPDAELLARIKREENRREPNGVVMSDNMDFDVALDNLQRREFAGDDYGCLVKHDVIIKDHSRVVIDGTEYDVVNSYGESKYKDGAEIGYIEYRSADVNVYGSDFALPAADDDVNEIVLGLKIGRYTVYHYKDATGYYVLYEVGEPEYIDFDIKRGGAVMRTGSAHAEFADYSMDVKVEMTAISTYVTTRYTYTEDGIGYAEYDWHTAEELHEKGKDALECIRITAGDVEHYDGYIHGSRDVSDGNMVFTNNYVLSALPGDVSEMMLFPQWVVAGEKPEEAITVKLN